MTAIHLVKGADPSLRDRVVARLVHDLLGADDAAFAVEDITIQKRAAGSADADAENGNGVGVEPAAFARVMVALDSPPLMTNRRIVIVREAGALGSDDAGRLAAWIESPCDTTALVLVAGGGRLSTKVTKAVRGVGGETHEPEAEQRSGRASGPVAEQLALSAREMGIGLSDAARQAIEAHLGEDAARVPELVALLRSVHGERDLDVDDVTAYLGDAGTAARFELANAIDRGEVAGALIVLDRLLRATSAKQPKPLHPIQILATLQFHFRDLLALDDPSIVTKEQAAETLGSKSPWAARHRLEASRALGSEGLRDAYARLAQADLDLRGASGAPADIVLEVLVARLAALARRRR